MDDEYARRIIEEGFNTVDRLRDIENTPREASYPQQQSAAGIEKHSMPTGALPSWRPAPEKIKAPSEPDWSGWDRWAEAHNKRAIDANNKLQHQVLAQVISDIRHQLRQEIESLRAEVAGLREDRGKGSVTIWPPTKAKNAR
jgi:hypothetical protein